MNFTLSDVVLIIFLLVAVAAGVLYWLNRKASVRMTEQQEIIDRNRMVQSIFVIDKRKDKLQNVNLPKAVVEQMPRLMKFRKNYFVQAKIGPQIMTFMCEKKVFNQLPLKKNVKVELVGIFILGIAGANQKTDNLQKTVMANSTKQAKNQLPKR